MYQEILSYLKEHHQSSSIEMANYFHKPIPTVRRNCGALKRKGLLALKNKHWVLI